MTPTYVTIHFEKGIPTAVDGKEMGAVELVEYLNKLGGETASACWISWRTVWSA